MSCQRTGRTSADASSWRGETKRSRADAREDGEDGLGEVGVREGRAIARERGLHLGRVECSFDGQADGAGSAVLDLAARVFECIAGAGEDRLVRGILVRDGEAAGAGDLDGELGTTENSEHAASSPLRGLLHEVTAARGEAQAVGVIESAGGSEGRELAQRVARGGGWARAAELLPAGEGRAVDGGLGVAGSVGDVLEGVGADELDRELEEVGAVLGDCVAHAFLVASLPREEQRCVGGLAHLPILVRLRPKVSDLGARTPRSAGYARRVGGWLRL